MTDTFDKLKAMLEEKGSLADEDIQKMVGESGEMTPEENMELAAAIHEAKRAGEATVTLEQYLEATKTLDNEEEGSEAYKAALAIVEKFESAN